MNSAIHAGIRQYHKACALLLEWSPTALSPGKVLFSDKSATHCSTISWNVFFLGGAKYENLHFTIKVEDYPPLIYWFIHTDHPPHVTIWAGVAVFSCHRPIFLWWNRRCFISQNIEKFCYTRTKKQRDHGIVVVSARWCSFPTDWA